MATSTNTLLSSGLTVATSVASIVCGGLTVRNYYRQWSKQQEGQEKTFTQKACTVAGGFFGIVEMGSGFLGLASFGLEVQHAKDLAEIEYIKNFQSKMDHNEIVLRNMLTEKAGCFSSKEFEEIQNGITDMSRRANELVDRVNTTVEKHRELYKKINTLLSAFCLGKIGDAVADNILKGAPGDLLSINFCFIATDAGGASYIAFSKSLNGLGNQDFLNSDCILKSLRLAKQTFYAILEGRRGGEPEKEKKPIKLSGQISIGGALFDPYEFPAVITPRLSEYERVPAYLHSESPFNQQVCPISLEPIAQALFIIQNQLPVAYEKASILNHVRQSRMPHDPLKNEKPRQLLNPMTGEELKECWIFECKEWNLRRAFMIAGRRYQEMERQKPILPPQLID